MFLYFVPKGTPLDVVSYAVDLGQRGRQLCERDVMANGPGGASGKLLCQCDDGFDVGYYPTRQSWEMLPEAHCGAYVGWYPDKLPTPELLSRESMLGGKAVTLADDHDWVVPVARQPEMSNGEVRYAVKLPRVLKWRDGDWILGGVERRYQSLMDISRRWAEVRFDSTEKSNELSVEYGELVSMAVDVLAHNYRVGPVELSALGVLTESTFVQILDAAIDVDGFFELLQKKTDLASESLSTSDGHAA